MTPGKDLTCGKKFRCEHAIHKVNIYLNITEKHGWFYGKEVMTSQFCNLLCQGVLFSDAAGSRFSFCGFRHQQSSFHQTVVFVGVYIGNSTTLTQLFGRLQ